MSATDGKILTTELLSVARVQPGYLSRQSVRPSANGTHVLIQAKDVSPATGIRSAGLVRFLPERQPELYQVARGDILIASRGREHQAYLVQDDLVDTLASSVFYIVRPRVESIIPAYLAWWLNRPIVQAQIDSGTRGTGIGYIARQTLEHLLVVVPPTDVQSRIAITLDLWRRQQLLQARLDKKREQLIHAVCQQAVQQEKEQP
jgi:hypothetical protein